MELVIFTDQCVSIENNTAYFTLFTETRFSVLEDSIGLFVVVRNAKKKKMHLKNKQMCNNLGNVKACRNEEYQSNLVNPLL